MREKDQVREILRGLSTQALELTVLNEEIELRPRTQAPIRLPLKVIRDRGPDAANQTSPSAFNLFLNAGPRLTSRLRKEQMDVAALATSTGLLIIRTGHLFVDIERELGLPKHSRRGPKLQGKSELIVEALLALNPVDDLPPLERLASLAAGHLGEGHLSVAQTQKVIARLEEDHVLKADRLKGPKYTRYFDLRKEELLQLWAREYMPGVTKSFDLYVTAKDADSVLSKLKGSQLSGRWVVAGPSAAQIWRPTLVPGPSIDVWADATAWDQLFATGSVVDRGVANLTVRRFAGAQDPLWFAHHQFKSGLPLVSPARAFVETTSSKGPRLDELADALFESIV
jgi:hypothetical protein